MTKKINKTFFNYQKIKNAWSCEKIKENDRLVGDVVAVVVEKILMNIGVTTHAKVSEILSDHNLTFSDCYQNPDVLNFALKELFGITYLSIVEKIENELLGFENSRTLSEFIQTISK